MMKIRHAGSFTYRGFEKAEGMGAFFDDADTRERLGVVLFLPFSGVDGPSAFEALVAPFRSGAPEPCEKCEALADQGVNALEILRRVRLRLADNAAALAVLDEEWDEESGGLLAYTDTGLEEAPTAHRLEERGRR
jgi:hypothetical protein